MFGLTDENTTRDASHQPHMRIVNDLLTVDSAGNPITKGRRYRIVYKLLPIDHDFAASGLVLERSGKLWGDQLVSARAALDPSVDDVFVWPDGTQCSRDEYARGGYAHMYDDFEIMRRVRQ